MEIDKVRALTDAELEQASATPSETSGGVARARHPQMKDYTVVYGSRTDDSPDPLRPEREQARKTDRGPLRQEQHTCGQRKTKVDASSATRWTRRSCLVERLTLLPLYKRVVG